MCNPRQWLLSHPVLSQSSCNSHSHLVILWCRSLMNMDILTQDRSYLEFDWQSAQL